jgi:type II secretion system protein H
MGATSVSRTTDARYHLGWYGAMTRMKPAGYTMVEILFVMLIMGVLAGFGYLRLGPAFERSKVRGAANVIATDIQLTQMLAVRHRQPVTFTVEADRTIRITDRADSVYVTRDLGGSDFGLETLEATASIEFFPSGVASGGTEITLSRGNTARKVTVTRTGQIRIENVP